MLHAGLLYDFSVDVVPALRKLKPKAHIEMFQAIDCTIVNPVFMLSFLGPVILLPTGVFLTRGEPGFGLLLAATIVQIVGSNAVTVAGHLPLNAELMKVDTAQLSEAKAEKIRTKFQGPSSRWVWLHTVRTLSSTAALALVLAALAA